MSFWPCSWTASVVVAQILDKAGFRLEGSEDQFRYGDVRKSLELKAGFTKEDLKAIRNLMKGNGGKSQTMASMMWACPRPRAVVWKTTLET